MYLIHSKKEMEINYFLLMDDECEIEVKAETNLKAKSLKTYWEKFQPELSIRTSVADYKREEWMLNLPLYAIETLLNILKQ